MSKFFTNTVLMVKPLKQGGSGFNSEAAETNTFQVNPMNGDVDEIHEKRFKEFEAFVKLLNDSNIKVIVVEPLENRNTPDCIFPNNWLRLFFEKKINFFFFSNY